MQVRFSRAALTAILVGTGVLAAPVAWSASTLAPSPAHDGEHANPLFARRVTGTWMEVGTGYGTTLSIKADGTITWFGTWFFGDGSGAFFNGPVYGTWKQTGPRELTTIEVGYLFDENNAWSATGRVVEVFTFSKHFESFTYSGSEDLLAPDQDPTDPNAIVSQSFTFSGGPINRLSHMN